MAIMVEHREEHPFTRMRRKDRGVDDEAWIRDFLRRAQVGTLATVHNGQPFINTSLFVYDEEAHTIYMHSAASGRTRANMDSDERVCFSASEMGRLLPADSAFGMSVEYASVVVFARARVLDDGVEKKRALQLLVDKYFPHLRPGQHYRLPTPEELALTAVYKIEIDQWSAKRKQAEQDFPGAFLFGSPPATPADAD